VKAQLIDVSGLFLSGYVLAEHENYRQYIFDEVIENKVGSYRITYSSYCSIRFLYYSHDLPGLGSSG
jgi:hypothetical protein